MSKYLDESGLNEFWTQIKTKLATKEEAAYTAGDNISISNNTVTGKIPVGYGTCNTAADAVEKVVTIADDDFVVKPGCIIGVKFTNTNTASGVRLNVNNSGGYSIYAAGDYYSGSSSTYCGAATRVNVYMWDGQYWRWLTHDSDDNSNTVPMPHCTTAATTRAKTATCTYYSLRTGSYFPILFRYPSTVKNSLTLNINSTGAKPIYINGSASSSTNYSIPAGIYIAYYDGTNYYINTTGDLIPYIQSTNQKYSGIYTNVKNTTTYDSYYPSIKFIKDNYGNRDTAISSTSDNTSVVTPKAVYDYVQNRELSSNKVANANDLFSSTSIIPAIDANTISSSSADLSSYYSVSAIKQILTSLIYQTVDYADSYNIWDCWKDGFVSVSDKFYFTSTDYYKVSTNTNAQAVFYVSLMGVTSSGMRFGYIQLSPSTLNNWDGFTLQDWTPIEMGYVDSDLQGGGTKHVITNIDSSMLNTTVGATPSNSKILSEKAITDYIASNTLLNSNKVTSITSSSTDTAIPSAKAVYDLFNDGMDEIGALIGTVSGS